MPTHATHASRKSAPKAYQGPYIDDCPASATDTPNCATCSEIDRCGPGSDRYDKPVKSVKSYPDCRKCSESQQKACSKKADVRFGSIMISAAMSVSCMIAGGIVRFMPMVIFCLFVAIADLVSLFHVMKLMQDGARSVHAFGCCAIAHKKRG